MYKKLWVLLGLLAMLSLLAGTLSCTSTTSPTPTPTATAPTSKPTATTPTVGPTIPSASPTPAEVIKLKYTFYYTLNDSIGKACQKLADMLTANAKGRIQLDVYPGGQLVAGKDAFEAVKAGTIDMSYTPPEYVAGIVPLVADISGMPWIYSRENWFDMFYQKGIAKIISDKYEAQGVKPLIWHPSSPGGMGFFYTKEVKTLEEAKGLKVRGPGGGMDSLIAMLGMTPVSLSSAEVILAAQTGVIQGAYRSISSAIGAKEYEALPYYFNLKVGKSVAPISINPKKFNSLPADLQKIFNDTAMEWLKWVIQDTFDEDVKLVETLKGLPKVTVYTPPATEASRWKAATMGYFENLKKKYGTEFDPVWKVIEPYTK